LLPGFQSIYLRSTPARRLTRLARTLTVRSRTRETSSTPQTLNLIETMIMNSLRLAILVGATVRSTANGTPLGEHLTLAITTIDVEPGVELQAALSRRPAVRVFAEPRRGRAGQSGRQGQTRQAPGGRRVPRVQRLWQADPGLGQPAHGPRLPHGAGGPGLLPREALAAHHAGGRIDS